MSFLRPRSARARARATMHTPRRIATALASAALVAAGVDVALAEEVRALIALARFDAAEARYHAAVAAKPALEIPELPAELAAARTAAGEGGSGKVLAFNRAGRPAPAVLDDAEVHKIFEAAGNQVAKSASSAEFGRFVQDEARKWDAIVKLADVKAG